MLSASGIPQSHLTMLFPTYLLSRKKRCVHLDLHIELMDQQERCHASVRTNDSL